MRPATFRRSARAPAAIAATPLAYPPRLTTPR